MSPVLLSAEQRLNPFPWYGNMRRSAPVFYDESNRVWAVFRYEDVKRVLSDYEVFSSARGAVAEGDGGLLEDSLVATDPPRHRRLRSLVEQAFTRRAVERLEPRIAAIVEELLDRVAPAGRMDVIEDFAVPLPVTVIAEMLGIPAGDRKRFKRWSDAVVAGADPARMNEVPGGAEVHREMGEYLAAIIERRREEPGEDLISGLLAAEIDGGRLGLRDLLGFSALLLIAGNETTTNLIGNAILCFDERPEAMDRLQAEPALMRTAIEEVLRYRSPVQAMFRTAVADTIIGDQEIKAGSTVLAYIGSANRDGAVFEIPERFDITRKPNRHIAFGYGIHRCLGAPLAQLEGRVALPIMLGRLAKIRRDRSVPLEPLDSGIMYGVKNLPITFAAA